ncbi:MAG: hybrid sensor histidine kinase/response regulator [Desulfobacterales bacterium]|nr:hybrid sensor histidine kinase/response regulator [Desulfobacterales bacterium]MBF0395725.1 hybrid sensor histidine kinase/response regulator [Desulfobacterales bacterium]
MVKKSKILVVDDVELNLLMLKKILTPLNYEIFLANDGIEAIEKTLEINPDLILLDIIMPRMNGFEVLQRLKGDDTTRKIPILIVTSMNEVDNRVKALELGADDILSKPFDITEISARVKSLIKIKTYYDQINEYQLAEKKRLEIELKSLYVQLKQFESQLFQAQKMSVLGTMVAGMAHELNNAMMGILNFVQHCLIHTSKEDKRYSFMQDAENQVNRCIKIVSDVLAISRAKITYTDEPEIINIKEITEQILRLLSHRIKRGKVEIFCEIPEEANKIWANHNIQQVFLNLINNALDAVKESQIKQIYISSYIEEQWVKIRIKDTGIGILPQDIDKIFAPFFTTKPVGQGTGLGLMICRNIIEAHGGRIVCESIQGENTTFTFFLPHNKL